MAYWSLVARWALDR